MTSTYVPEYLPSTHDIHDTFLDEITSLGGVVSDVYDDGHRLFARAILADVAEILPGDAVSAGVTVRAAGSEILVHPYKMVEVGCGHRESESTLLELFGTRSRISGAGALRLNGVRAADKVRAHQTMRCSWWFFNVSKAKSVMFPRFWLR